MNVDLDNTTLPKPLANLLKAIINAINSIQPSQSDAPVWE